MLLMRRGDLDAAGEAGLVEVEEIGRIGLLH